MMAKLDEMVRTTVTQVRASAMPRTDSTKRSGLRRMFAQANRRRHPMVLFPDEVAIGGGREITVEAGVSTPPIFGAPCFADRSR
ncbi:hypothetical protein MSAR_31690 [Mycolicibacterium sarraceniae]|uniref:Uncharacterized protein n=1 Tax=Mycolicibacterium sarraceniae TaxID=1534348 RepID=A0A7I7STI7_9MYCO|nr:hypothetical protein MSAR_31690 [Mycolicibacterium sarraceniae]